MNIKRAPILILHGSKQPYISLGCYTGGIKMYGYEYVYMSVKDAFLRKDYLKIYNKHIKKNGNWNSFIELIKSEQ